MFALTQGERKALVHAALLVALSAVGRAALSPPPAEIQSEGMRPAGDLDSTLAVAESLGRRRVAGGIPRRIDINQAGPAELARLPGVGPALAESLVETRGREGPFRKLADLEQVRGFGSTRISRVAPFLAPLPEDGIGPREPPGRKPRLDLNRATEEELLSLPGIGPVKAREIIKWRGASGPFRSPDDLLKVPGIGPKTVEKLRPLVGPGP